MKNYFLALCILLLAGCTKADVESVSYQKIDSPQFYAEFAEDDTRTFVDEKVRLLWTEGDLLTIFTTTLNQKYQFDGETGDNSGTFTPISAPQFGTGNNISANYAVYPYSSSTKISNDEVITLSLPATQQYAENSFGPNANTMVAVTSGINDYFLPFKNVGGFLRLQLYGEGVTVKSIQLQGNNSEKIAGKATVVAKYGKSPELEMGDDATETITLDCGDGVELGATAAEATDFWIVVPPTTFTKGFTITITDTDGLSMTKSTTKEYIVERNVLKSMSAFEVEETGIIGFVSDANNIQMREVSLHQEKSTIYVSMSLGAINPLSKDYTINIEEDETLIDEYNVSNFDTDESKYALPMDDSWYDIESYTCNIKPGSATYEIPIKISPSGMSPDATYFIPLRIVESDVTALNPQNKYLLLQIRIKNHWAHSFGTEYTMLGNRKNISNDNQPDVYIPHSKFVYPISDKRVRVFVANETKSIEDWAMVLTIGDPIDGVHPVDINPYHNLQVWKVKPTDEMYDEKYPNTYSIVDDGFNVYKTFLLQYCYYINDILFHMKEELRVKYEEDSDVDKGFEIIKYEGSQPSNNKIYYTSSDGNIVTPYENDFGAIIVSNVYENGQGVITFDRDVQRIGVYSFYDRRTLSSITVPNSVTEIGEHAFNYCSALENINIPVGVKKIGDYAFSRCYQALRDISIPNGVIEIGKRAFENCEVLTSITIPNSVTLIGFGVFQNCSNLTDIYVKAINPPTGNSYMFVNNAASRKIYVPHESVNAYKNAGYWKDYADDIVGYEF